MEVFYRVLEIINWVVIGIAILSFLFQFVMIAFVGLKPKKFPVSKNKKKIAVLVLARNEEAVIAHTVSHIFKQNYPKNKFDVYVVAHNCTDNTFEEAKKAGAIVIARGDDDPKKRRVSWAFKYGVEYILSLNKDYDFLVRFDADNLPEEMFLSKMNDAFNSGVELARGFEASTNATQNMWTSVSFNYYVRDSRIASNFRERMGIDSMLPGPGMSISMKILKESGWDALGTSEDSEYTLNRLLENKRTNYVSDAVVYEDQPSTAKDTWNRITRMGHGLHNLFWKKGWRLFGHFFKSGRWSNVDLFMQLVMVVFSVLAFGWFVPYYLAYEVCHLINWVGPNFMGSISGLDGKLFTPLVSQGKFLEILIFGAIVLGSFIIIYPLQAFLGVRLSKDILKYDSIKKYLPGIAISPLFMLFYGLGIFVGVISKPKWKQIKRNKVPKDAC